MIHRTAWLVSSVAVLAMACSSTSADDDDDSNGSANASAGEISRCKQGCDKMKFFDCSSAAELSGCYEDCDSADAKRIETFTACAENSICDPECRTSIKPPPAKGEPAPKGEGASAESCESACGKLAECSFIKVGDTEECEALCKKEAYQFQIDCVVAQECSKIEKTCGGGELVSEEGGNNGNGSSGGETVDTAGIAQCKNACDLAQVSECFDAAKQSDCREKCDGDDKASRDTFNSCMLTAGSECADNDACYDEF